MSSFDLSPLWQNLGLVVGRPKRTPLSQNRWGFETERLEERALLSPGLGGQIDAPAEVSVSDRKTTAPYPNLAGTWNVIVTGNASLTGNVVVTGAGSGEFNAVFNLPGLPAITANVERKNARVKAEVTAAGQNEDLHLRGKYNKSHNEISLRTVVRDAENNRIKVNMVFTFNSNTNPTTFNATISASNGVQFMLAGTRQLEL